MATLPQLLIIGDILPSLAPLRARVAATRSPLWSARSAATGVWRLR